MWGLPPKKVLVKHNNLSVSENNMLVLNWLELNDFEILSHNIYVIEAKKKLKPTISSFFSGGKAFVFWTVYITEEGRITVKSRYDFDSMYGMPFYDLGRQQKLMNKFELDKNWV